MNNENETNNEQEENFEELLNQSFANEMTRLEPGQKVEAAIVKIAPEWTFIGIGGKGEGCIPSNELKDKDGNFFVKEGDIIRAYFLKSEDGEMRFTTQVGSGPAARTMLNDAMNEHIPLEGTISKAIKGGFEVILTGGARAFCPFSHMGLRRTADKEDYTGSVLNFYVIELKGRSATLSRKEIAEAERKEKIKELKETLNLGDRVAGKVTSIQKFGAFVDFGGVEGLLPISEISWERTAKVSDILSVGQPVEVIIKSMDWENEKFSLSLKDTLPNPWDTAAETYTVGSYHNGKVSRFAPFGAFINLSPAVDGLIHISKLSGDKKIKNPEDVLTIGQEIEVKVDKIDVINKKISLIPASLSREEDEKQETISKYQTEDSNSSGRFGTFGEILKQKLDAKAKGN